jgi:hypothetical protein
MEVIKMIIILVSTLVGIMFYQPWMDPNYRHNVPTYTKKELKIKKFKEQIDRLLQMERYESVVKILMQTKYTAKEIPLEYWKQQIQERRNKYEQNSYNIPKLIQLEKTIDKLI